jgi:hypothetical protein
MAPCGKPPTQKREVGCRDGAGLGQREAKLGMPRARSALKLIQIDETSGQVDTNQPSSCEPPGAVLEDATQPSACAPAGPQLEDSERDASALAARVAALEEQLALKDRHLSQMQTMLVQSSRAQDLHSGPPVGPWAWSRYGPTVPHVWPQDADDSEATEVEEQRQVVASPGSVQKTPSQRTPAKEAASSQHGVSPQRRQQPRQMGGQQGCRGTSPRRTGDRGTSPRRGTSPVRASSPPRANSRPPPEKSQADNSPRHAASPRRTPGSNYGHVRTCSPSGQCSSRAASPNSQRSGRATSPSSQLPSRSSIPNQRLSGREAHASVRHLPNDLKHEWERLRREYGKRTPPQSTSSSLVAQERFSTKQSGTTEDFKRSSTQLQVASEDVHEKVSTSQRIGRSAPSNNVPRQGCSPVGQKVAGAVAAKPVACVSRASQSHRTSPWRPRNGQTVAPRRSSPSSASNGRPVGSGAPPPVSQGAACSARHIGISGILGIQRDYSGTWLSVEEQLKLNSARLVDSNFQPSNSAASCSDWSHQDVLEPFGGTDDFVQIERLVNDGV